MERSTSDGVVVSAEPGGMTRARGSQHNILLDGVTTDEVVAAYERARTEVGEVLRQRRQDYPGSPNISADLLDDLIQYVVLVLLRLNQVTGKGLTFRLNRRHDDLNSAAARRVVQEVVGRTVPRFSPGHDELCAALLGISVEKYQTWAGGNDQHVNR